METKIRRLRRRNAAFNPPLPECEIVRPGAWGLAVYERKGGICGRRVHQDAVTIRIQTYF